MQKSSFCGLKVPTIDDLAGKDATEIEKRILDRPLVFGYNNKIECSDFYAQGSHCIIPQMNKNDSLEDKR
eukprot:UN07893